MFHSLLYDILINQCSTYECTKDEGLIYESTRDQSRMYEGQMYECTNSRRDNIPND